MSKVRVNYKSDLPPVAVKFKINGSVVNVPDHDFIIRFFVDGAPGTSFECAHKGDVYVNCAKTAADTLTCYIDNHKFGCGRLCCEFIDLSIDSRYDDKVRKTVTPSCLDVVLVEGAGDDNIEILNVIFGYEINEIASITAVESQEDGGTNVITITETNGDSFSFNVKNGSKGADGEAGADGQDGQDGTDGQDGKSAYQSYVDTTTDDPVKTETEWLASLHGLNGVVFEGDPATYIADNLTTDDSEKILSAKQGKVLKDLIDSQTFPIVDDLTTGGTTSALSANQGKVLGETVNGILTDYSSAWSSRSGYYASPAVGSAYTLSDGVPVVTSSSSWRCYYIEVEAGEKYKLTGIGGSSNTLLWVLTDTNFVAKSRASNNATASNLTITPSVDGYLVVNGTKNDTKKLSHLVDGLTQKVDNLMPRVTTLESTAVTSSALSDIATSASTSLSKTSGYIDNYPVGTVVSTTPTSSSLWYSIVTSVNRGDEFVISTAKGGAGASTKKPYAWCNSSYVVTSVNSGTEFSGTIVAPADGYLVINGYSALTVSKKSKAKTIENNVSNNSNSIDAIKNIMGLVDMPMSDYNLSTREIGADDMIWTWWYYPQAITLGTRHRPLMFGYADSKLKTGVAKWCGDVVVKRPLKYYKTSTYDDHSSCALLEMSNGKIMYVSDGNHGASNYLNIRISSKAGDIDSFGNNIRVLAASNGCSYAQILYINSTYYIFYRDGSSNPSVWRCITSNDGTTWSEPSAVVNSTYQYYCLFRPVSDEATTIRILMYSNPNMSDTNIRQGFIDATTGKIYNSDGTTELGSIGDGVSRGSFTTLVSEPSGGYNRLLDAAITAKASPLFSYCSFTSNSGAANYYVYKGGSSHYICVDDAPFYTGSGYHGGMAFVGTGKVVVSRYENSTDQDVIEIYELTNYTSEKVLNRYNTHSKTYREVRPIVDKDGLFVITQKGYYDKTQYKSFCMTATIYEL